MYRTKGFLGMSTPGFGDFLLFFLADSQQLWQVEWWMLVACHFQVSSEMAHPGEAIQRHSQSNSKPLSKSLLFFLAVFFVLLKGGLLAMSDALSPLVRFSSQISLYITVFLFPSIATSHPVPAAQKQPHNMMLLPPCLTVGIALGRWSAVPVFVHTRCLELRLSDYLS